MWDNFEAHVFEETDKILSEYDRKAAHKNLKRTFYKVSLDRSELDKFEPKSITEQNVSFIFFEEN